MNQQTNENTILYLSTFMLLDYERMSEANEVSQSRERNVVEFTASCLNIDVLPI
nr:MAG TPA: hypothetical protein [Caudoviricetes sp.]